MGHFRHSLVSDIFFFSAVNDRNEPYSQYDHDHWIVVTLLASDLLYPNNSAEILLADKYAKLLFRFP
jgi:hypothetical protein